jgi:hypothetical protein
VTVAPGRLHIDKAGKLQGPADITINDPFPTHNGTAGAFGTAQGGVIHTEVGFEHAVIDEFNNPAAQASAFFSIGMDGHIHQYGPLGHDWMAWTQIAGNPHWRGVEHEDKGHPETPMPAAQLAASAQVFEAMSAFDGWPLAPTDDPVGGRGIIFHSDGGVAWGNHDCPGSVRRAQRPVIIALAKQIRAGDPLPAGRHTADGTGSMAALAARQRTTVDDIWWETALSLIDAGFRSGFGDLEGKYLNSGQWDAPMPKGMVLWLP